MLMVTSCRRIAVAGFVACGLGRPCSAQTTFSLPDTTVLSAAERGLLRFEQNRSAAIARHDTVELRQMYADTFRGVTATGFAVDRAALLGVFTRDDPTVVFTIDDITVRTIGVGHDAAFLTGRLVTRRRAGEVVATSRFLHVYELVDGRWRIIAAQGTALPL